MNPLKYFCWCFSFFSVLFSNSVEVKSQPPINASYQLQNASKAASNLSTTEKIVTGSLSKRHIVPGDPIISINAPPDTKRVTAYFPFGLVKKLKYDKIRNQWRGRFLVPAGIPDGLYNILVTIELADGKIINRQQGYELDSFAEEFIARFNHYGVFPGDDIQLFVDTIESAAEVYVHCPELGWNRTTIKPTANGENIYWKTTLKIPASATPEIYGVMVAVRDLAGNRSEKWITIVIERGEV